MTSVLSPSDFAHSARPDRHASCGWYDSSHDLSRGLTVVEDLSAAELPLASWLEQHLMSWQAPVSAI